MSETLSVTSRIIERDIASLKSMGILIRLYHAKNLKRPKVLWISDTKTASRSCFFEKKTLSLQSNNALLEMTSQCLTLTLGESLQN